MADDLNARAYADLANALQTALLLAQRLGPDLQQLRDTADDLRASVERAAGAASQLRDEQDGDRS